MAKKSKATKAQKPAERCLQCGSVLKRDGDREWCPKDCGPNDLTRLLSFR